MLQDIIIVCKHELLNMKRSARIWIAISLYTLMAILSGLVFILIVRGVESSAVKLMIKDGGNAYAASKAVESASDQIYVKLLELIASGDSVMVQSLIDIPPILLFAFWITLTFMPFLLALLGFDSIAADLQYRSICFPLLRISRINVYLGKYLAQLAVYAVLVIILNGILFLMGLLLLHSFNMGSAVVFLVKSYFLLLPFGMCYLALISLVSSLNRSPFLALIGSIGALFFLWLLDLLQYLQDAELPWNLLAWLAKLSPSHWEFGLWSPHYHVLAYTVGIYLLFSAIFSAIGVLRFHQMDIK